MQWCCNEHTICIHFKQFSAVVIVDRCNTQTDMIQLRVMLGITEHLVELSKHYDQAFSVVFVHESVRM